ncbi:hypothetical protein DZA65_00966 [Dickeya dianthicola]|uniref:TIGR03747 family integrating conjugative element membrane protein n=1 Tax=Dickeya dianthicola TaxID=204039 RepID=A0ABX9NRC7_9GAMM|nr:MULTISPECIES: TIGR03747 family integrating conjugative element membrane protein [Dickeya]AYC17871.1 hypothetical protein DZA65_00966 [Dickeya dianthicola]MBI0438081.1 TIGR03747 family integrating conjugative element membrane protein [Dickeya dianthicola]MBI0448303.1 TIGR03747 family integrating conjugative element membrane protein [Dickeya dianthicola]MBI0452964.1 TIGR03747 family integrating conjugative element membrane protein [Dickeya dianthicola]MBI0457408.1 TIGR03747 family integrating
MAQTQQQSQQQRPAAPPKQSGPIMFLLWDLPWKLVGIFLAAWLVSIIVEFACMTLIWPTAGAEHSREVLHTESAYLSEGFTRSLLMSEPVITMNHVVNRVYQWGFVDTGFISWLNGSAAPQTAAGHRRGELLEAISQTGRSLAMWVGEYLEAMMYVTLIYVIRVCILVLSIPLFVLVIITGVVDGLVRRDLRRYGAGYESSFLYHHAKRFIKPAFYGPTMLYLGWPTAVWPNLLILPAAVLLGGVISVTMGAFKKYL